MNCQCSGSEIAVIAGVKRRNLSRGSKLLTGTTKARGIHSKILLYRKKVLQYRPKSKFCTGPIITLCTLAKTITFMPTPQPWLTIVS